jgi:hypothetical protein
MVAMMAAFAAPAASRPRKKAAAQKSVAVVHEGVRYVASNRLIASGTDSKMEAFVEAWDAKSKKKLWEVRLEEPPPVKSDTAMDDHQPVVVTSMKVAGGLLIVSARAKRTYEVDLESHTASLKE